jgi:hypothetical protein
VRDGDGNDHQDPKGQDCETDDDPRKSEPTTFLGPVAPGYLRASYEPEDHTKQGGNPDQQDGAYRAAKRGDRETIGLGGLSVAVTRLAV